MSFLLPSFAVPGPAAVFTENPVLHEVLRILPILLALGLLLWALINPRIGRLFAKAFAVLAIGGGIGVLTWGICSAASGEPIRSLAAFPTLLTTPSEAIGLGAGLLISGVTALVLALVRSRQRTGKVPQVWTD